MYRASALANERNRNFPSCSTVTSFMKRSNDDGKCTKKEMLMMEPPVLLIHGLSSTSEVWVSPKRNDCLAIILADNGYDVWLGNLRGNALSRKHITLDPSNKKYWDFSWHENGVYDITAQLKMILNVTGKQPAYIGYSLSATAFLAMASSRPNDVAKKVKIAILLAPVLAVSRPGLQYPLATLVYQFAPDVIEFLSKISNGEMTKRTPLVQKLIRGFCSGLLQPICLLVLNLGLGQSPLHIDKERMGFITSCLPGGTSARTLLHFLQVFKSGKFRQYDFGWNENLVRYKTVIPPEYDLRKIETSVAIFYSHNDPLINSKVLQKLKNELPNVVEMYCLPDKYSHLDYMYSTVSKDVLFQPILNILDRAFKKNDSSTR